MIRRDILRNVLLVLGALALMAVLAFLYDRTQTVDMRDQNEVLDALRMLKEIDARWDTEVQQARTESGAGPRAVSRLAAGRALDALTVALRSAPSPALSAALPELRKAILDKEELVRKFRIENAAAKTAAATVGHVLRLLA